MNNPLLTPSPLPFGAPRFDAIRAEHWLPAFRAAIAAGKAEVDRIAGNPEPPTFRNTVEALEFAGDALETVSGLFFNLLEAESDDRMQQTAEKVSPLLTGYELYISLNAKLFARIKAVYDARASLDLAADQRKLLEDSYKDFVRSGALLSEADKKTYGELEEELSLLELKFGKNVLDATNAFTLHLTDAADLEGLPQYVRDAAAQTAREKGLDGWVIDLTHPSYVPFLQFSARADLRERLWRAYNARAFGGPYDNRRICLKISDLRRRIAQLLGYSDWAAYALEERMAKDVPAVRRLLDTLMLPSLPAARREVAQLLAYARKHGYREAQMQPWDFSYWSERYRAEHFALSDEQLKPYFRLEACIDAVFGLATRLYGCDPDRVRAALKEFTGLRHRLQFAGNIGGVDYYDDSISTIPEAAIAAIRSIPNARTILLGGMDRNIDYDILIDFIREHGEYNYILMYKSGERIFRQVSDLPCCHYREDLEGAVQLAREITPAGGACLLSPAAASYGYFKNFEERGDVFQELIKG